MSTTKSSSTTSTSSSSTKLREIVQKALAVNSQPTEITFPEFPDVMVWFRAVLAILYSAYVLFLKTSSSSTNHLTVLVQSVNVIVFIPYLYAKFYLGVSNDNFVGAILFSGTLNALALFLLIWIGWFTSQHETEVSQLYELALLSGGNGTEDGAATDYGGTNHDPPTVPTTTTSPVEEPEF